MKSNDDMYPPGFIIRKCNSHKKCTDGIRRSYIYERYIPADEINWVAIRPSYQQTRELLLKSTIPT